MITPAVDEFVLLAERAGARRVVVPVFEEILADLDTPVSAFLKVSDRNYSFLLESVEGGERWARYSFIGLDPEFVVRATGQRCELLEDDRVVATEERADPLEFLKERLDEYAPVEIPGLPRFVGGAVGWIGWDAIRWWEELPDTRPLSPEAFPTLVFSVPRTLLVFDNIRHRILVVVNVFCAKGDDARAAHAQAVVRIRRMVEILRHPLARLAKAPAETPPVSSAGARDEYERAVERIKEYIHEGDCIQVVPSRRYRLSFQGDPVDLYRALRAVNPSPYMFCLRYPELTVIGASPEVLIRVEKGEMMVAPIAGTRARGATDAEDRALETDLLADPKERAEHVMLVDLARNDLGRVAAKGTVRTDNLMHVQRYSHVMHIVSEVRATLAEGKTAYDAVRSAFPAGTLSGAPKIRAMQIIDELEPARRELYGGAVGYFGFSGNVDLCIAIRTAWSRGGDWTFQVGAGIVADSDPALEYQETVNKAGAMLRALELARRGL
jgi:anthranilate synthase component 1